MSRSNLFLLVLALAIFGTSVIAGHPDWGTFTGLAILLLAGGMAVGALPMGSDSDLVERVPGKKISTSLATLSSAAVLAVYVAGYHRTGSAAGGFADQSARRSRPAPTVALAVSPQPIIPGVTPSPAVRSSPPPPSKKASPRASSSAAANAPPPPLANENSAASGFAPTAIRPADEGPKPIVPLVVTPQGKYKDGTYLGWGTSRHGDIQASVVIQGGQIVSADIAKCLTRYSCNWIAALPGQVIQRQSPAVDYVSGATQSCDAFSDAVAQALMNASASAPANANASAPAHATE
jgi:uncharacterized protein with FMN-binding domain